MKYLLLCCHEEKKVDSMSKSELDAIMEETMSYCEVLKKSGHLLGVEALEPIQTAMSVKVRNGKLSVTDGPFAENEGAARGVLPDQRPRLERGDPGGLEVSVGAVRNHGSAAGEGPSQQRPLGGCFIRSDDRKVRI